MYEPKKHINKNKLTLYRFLQTSYYLKFSKLKISQVFSKYTNNIFAILQYFVLLVIIFFSAVKCQYFRTLPITLPNWYPVHYFIDNSHYGVKRFHRINNNKKKRFGLTSFSYIRTHQHTTEASSFITCRMQFFCRSQLVLLPNLMGDFAN